MATLELKLLGGMELRLCGSPLKLRYPSAQALLAYLAVSGEPHSRDALADLLWGELTGPEAKANLRRVISSLRQDLAAYVELDGDLVTFNRAAPYTLDVELFGALLGGGDSVNALPAAQLEAALGLYRGDFLKGFTLPDAPDFDDWSLGRLEALKDLALAALRALAAQWIVRGRYGAAADALRRLLVLDPWSEEGCFQLLVLLALSGERDAALAEFRRYGRRLGGEFGEEPSRALRELATRIREGENVADLLRPPQHNLTAPPTPLLGRDALLAEVATRLTQPECRLLTLVGPGGVGKTRLGLEVGWQVLGGLRDGVFFVPLAPVSDPDLVAGLVVQALGLEARGNVSPAEILEGALRERQTLLILDNFEQVTGAAPLVAGLLGGCPQLKVLVTSRTPLRLRGEREVSVPPLPTPPEEPAPGLRPGPADPADPATLLGYPSVALFCERTRAVKADFRLGGDNALAVARICAQLDGLPLAIELAAARGKLLSPQALAARLGDRLGLLSRGAADLPERHQTLRATLAWSYDLLAEGEKRLFGRLGVAVGGCSLELAAALAGEADADDAEETLASLLDKSLLGRVAAEEGAPRLVMLETVREYALERLAESPREERASRERHAGYFSALLGRLRLPLLYAEKEAMREVGRDLANIRAAWLWAAAEGRAALMQPTSLLKFFSFSGRYREGIRLFADAAERLGDDGDAEMRGHLYSSLAWFYHRIGDMAGAVGAAERGVGVLRPLGRPELSAAAVDTLAGVLFSGGDFRGSRHRYLEALELFGRADMRSEYARTFGNLALLASALGDYPEALALYERQRELYSPPVPEQTAWAAYSLVSKGAIYYQSGDLGAAQSLLEEAYALSRTLDDVDIQMRAAFELGLTVLAAGAAERAQTLLDEALALALAADDAAQAALAHTGLAQAAMDTDRQGAASHLREALVTVKDTGLTAVLLGCLLGVAELWLRLSRHDEARSLLLLVRDHPASWAHDRRRAERLLGSRQPASTSRETDLTILSARTLAHLGDLVGDCTGFV